MPALLNDDIRAQVKDVFDAQLEQPVEVLFFGSTSEEKCAYCTDTRQLVEEVVEISEKLHLSIYDIDGNAQIAQTYRVDKTPVLVITGRGDTRATTEDGAPAQEPFTDFGVRFTGLPAGHEFSSLIQSMILVSRRDSGLKLQTRQFLKELSKPIHLQVFVTPT
jgi:glutaredoxin-like protein